MYYAVSEAIVQSNKETKDFAHEIQNLDKYLFRNKNGFFLDLASETLNIAQPRLRIILSYYLESDFIQELVIPVCPDDYEGLLFENGIYRCLCGKEYLAGQFIDRIFYQVNQEAKVNSIRDQIFISYSHANEWWLNELKKFLAPVLGKMEIWDDTRINAGDKWKEEIEKALRRTKIALLLVSPDFFASKFIQENELPPLLSAAQIEGAKITWIAISSSLYQHSQIAQYEALNNPSKPLDKLGKAKRNEELARIGNDLYRLYSES